MIIDVPSFSFFEPSLITFFKLEYLLDLTKCIGLRHAKAQPKKGIYNNSRFIILDEGINNVCKKKDSHAPWWFETIMQGSAGMF